MQPHRQPPRWRFSFLFRRVGLRWLTASLALVLNALQPAAAQAQEDSPLGMSYVQTADQRLIYFDSLGYLWPHSLRTFANAHAWQRRVLSWKPSEPVTVLLKDFADYGNGAAWVAPRNTLFLDVAPQSLAFETSPSAERLYSLMNHELVHIAMGDSASSQDQFWRRIFRGKVASQSQNPETLLYNYLTVPRFTVPRWYIEGSAAFLETWMGGGLGRAQGGYDEMVFRAMVRDGATFYDPLGLVSRGVLVDFQVGVNAYLYGTRFITWLAYAHSPEKVVAWFRRDDASRRHYADQFQHVFGLLLERAWADWIAFEQDFQRRNLARVREQPVTPHQPLKGIAAGSVSRTFYDEKTGQLIGAFRLPDVIEHVGALDTRTGSYRKIGDIKKGMLYRVTSLAYDAASGTVFFTSDNHAMRDLMAMDLQTGEQRALMQDARIGDVAFNPSDRSMIGVRHHDGLASLVRIAHPYTEWTLIRTLPYGMVPYDLDISADGRMLSASVSEVNTDQFVRVWALDRLLAGDDKPISEFKFGQSVPESFVFSRDGRHLYGSSYYTGASNIFRFEVANGAVEALTNAETGFFRPLEMSDGRMLVLNYTGQGFVPALIEPKLLKDVSAITFLGAEVASRHPVVTTWQVPSPATVDETKLVTARGIYAPLREVRFQNAYPVLQGYKNVAGLGYRFNFSDPVQFANLSATVAVTPAPSGGADSERVHLDVQGQYLGWRAGLSWNKSDFYDLFGPTKRSRKGLALRLGHDELLIYDDPRKLEWSNDIAFYNKIDTLPDAQNVGSGVSRLTTLETKLNYTDVRRSLGAVDDEKGLRWRAALTVSRAGDSVSSQLRGGIDYGLALPWLSHSSIWLRTAAGLSDGNADDPRARFYFGGFGNNKVDNGAVQRYREQGSLPGFKLDAVPARRFVKQTLEWTLPPLIFESVGIPALHLTWLRPALFASALRASGDRLTPARTAASVGAQADLRFSVQHWYDMVLSISAAAGYDGSRRVGNEWMVSLKIM